MKEQRDGFLVDERHEEKMDAHGFVMLAPDAKDQTHQLFKFEFVFGERTPQSKIRYKIFIGLLDILSLVPSILPLRAAMGKRGRGRLQRISGGAPKAEESTRWERPARVLVFFFTDLEAGTAGLTARSGSQLTNAAMTSYTPRS